MEYLLIFNIKINVAGKPKQSPFRHRYALSIFVLSKSYFRGERQVTGNTTMGFIAGMGGSVTLQRIFSGEC